MSALQYGAAVGIAVGLILVVIVLKAINKDGAVKTKYDERQLVARGNAYRYGFFSTIICCAILLVLDMDGDISSKLGYVSFFIPVMAGLIVQISYSIFSDAYVGQNTNMTKFIVIMTAISVFNLLVGLIPLVRGELLSEGKLTGPFINLTVGLLFIIVAAELLVKKAIDSREERD
ncbi:MAG: hypothetical protein IKI75_07025 [Lachnospiraceae bacterium]|nr:hypothetical protein [Lachnospiraceae bacterium]